MVGGLPAIVLSFKFHQHRLNGYLAKRGQILAIGYTTAVGLLLYDRDYLGKHYRWTERHIALTTAQHKE